MPTPGTATLRSRRGSRRTAHCRRRWATPRRRRDAFPSPRPSCGRPIGFMTYAAAAFLVGMGMMMCNLIHCVCVCMRETVVSLLACPPFPCVFFPASLQPPPPQTAPRRSILKGMPSPSPLPRLGVGLGMGRLELPPGALNGTRPPLSASFGDRAALSSSSTPRQSNSPRSIASEVGTPQLSARGLPPPLPPHLPLAPFVAAAAARSLRRAT